MPYLEFGRNCDFNGHNGLQNAGASIRVGAPESVHCGKLEGQLARVHRVRGTVRQHDSHTL